MHTTTKKTSITQSRPPPSSSKTAPKTNKREPKPNKKYLNNEDMISMLDVPRCMAEKGYTFPIAFPDKNTQWNEELKKVSTIQLSPVDSTLVLVYVEWYKINKNAAYLVFLILKIGRMVRKQFTH